MPLCLIGPTLYIKQSLLFLKKVNTQKSIHEYNGKNKKMAFLIKYQADMVNKVRKDTCFLKAYFSQMKPGSLLFHAYLL
jgi:hypothetical protein